MYDLTEDVIKEAANGDMQAFRIVYDNFSGFVYNISLRVTRDVQLSQEVTQDVFLSVYKNLKKFRFESSVKTWIYRLAVNMAINAVKKRNRENSRTVEYDDSLKLQSYYKTVYEDIDAKDNMRRLEGLMRFLNPDQRAVIMLRSMEGLSYQEIAEVLKVNVNTVRTRIKRAREKLAEKFLKRGDNNEVSRH